MTTQPMTRAGDLLVIPEWMFRRSSVASRNRDDVTYICTTCGVVEPREYANGYIRRECKCEQLAREVQAHGMLLTATKQQTVKQKAAKTYTWLGRGLDTVYRKDVEERELEGKTFANFDPASQPNKAAFKEHLFLAKTYASSIISGQSAQKVQVDNMLMTGGYGTGKTHLAAAILNALREQGISCLFCTAQDLFNSLYASKFDEKLDLLAQAANTPLLVLDDLDKLHMRADTDGAFQKRTLFEMLDKRYKRHLPTIVTTNETQDLSPWLDGATISRLYEHLTLLEMDGVDYRSRENK